jgi:hypothetical protein
MFRTDRGIASCESPGKGEVEMAGPEFGDLLKFAVPLFFVFTAVFGRLLSKALSRTVSVQGRVESSQMRQVYDPGGGEGYIPVVTYSYMADERYYSGSTEETPEGAGRVVPWKTPVPKAVAESIAARFQPGSTCRVQMDKSDHARSTLLMPGVQASSTRGVAVLVAAGIAVAAAAMIAFLAQSGHTGK